MNVLAPYCDLQSEGAYVRMCERVLQPCRAQGVDEFPANFVTFYRAVSHELQYQTASQRRKVCIVCSVTKDCDLFVSGRE